MAQQCIWYIHLPLSNRNGLCQILGSSQHHCRTTLGQNLCTLQRLASLPRPHPALKQDTGQGGPQLSRQARSKHAARKAFSDSPVPSYSLEEVAPALDPGTQLSQEEWFDSFWTEIVLEAAWDSVAAAFPLPALPPRPLGLAEK